jgi:hypothetical protein
MATLIVDEADVRRIAREESARPALTTSRNCEAVIGIPPWRFCRDAKAKHFPSYVDHRMVVARTVDALAYYESRIQLAAAPPANDHDPEAVAFARVGARRVAG